MPYSKRILPPYVDADRDAGLRCGVAVSDCQHFAGGDPVLFIHSDRPASVRGGAASKNHVGGSQAACSAYYLAYYVVGGGAHCPGVNHALNAHLAAVVVGDADGSARGAAGE